MNRLNAKNLAQAKAQKPNYHREDVKMGIVHLGIGAFHRAHQAVYIDDLLAKDPQWGILGISLRSHKTAEALNPQDNLFTVATNDASGQSNRIIASVLDVITAPKNPQAVLDALCAATTRIVSLTITEKGYCHDPATGNLDQNHADIIADLATPSTPKTAIGYIVEALRIRHEENVAPFTVLSCDNLPTNGKITQKVILQYAAFRDANLAQWIEQNVTFPSTMVDRIVPATTDENGKQISKSIGFEDAWPVMAEPFTQWVIEDNFCNDRPAYETVGAQLVDDVEPYELMKLRMLNGSHSTIAYLGYLAGYKTVAEVMGDAKFETLITNMMTTEIIPSLYLPNVDLPIYRDQLIERFKNPALNHLTWQIAMDGSQKLPQRILDTIRANITTNRPYDSLILCVAAWMQYATAIDLQGNDIDVRDPLADQLHEIGKQTDLAEMVKSYASITSIFGNFAKNQKFLDKVTNALQELVDK
ncbi:MAG: mannitol dehydrogenase family protein [Hyphomicrobiales bacterium]